MHALFDVCMLRARSDEHGEWSRCSTTTPSKCWKTKDRSTSGAGVLAGIAREQRRSFHEQESHCGCIGVEHIGNRNATEHGKHTKSWTPPSIKVPIYMCCTPFEQYASRCWTTNPSKCGKTKGRSNNGAAVFTGIALLQWRALVFFWGVGVFIHKE